MSKSAHYQLTRAQLLLLGGDHWNARAALRWVIASMDESHPCRSKLLKAVAACNVAMARRKS